MVERNSGFFELPEKNPIDALEDGLLVHLDEQEAEEFQKELQDEIKSGKSEFTPEEVQEILRRLDNLQNPNQPQTESPKPPSPIILVLPS